MRRKVCVIGKREDSVKKGIRMNKNENYREKRKRVR